jgi:hypothetical protein
MSRINLNSTPAELIQEIVDLSEFAYDENADFYTGMRSGLILMLAPEDETLREEYKSSRNNLDKSDVNYSHHRGYDVGTLLGKVMQLPRPAFIEESS